MSAKEEVVLQAVPNSIKFGAVGLLVLFNGLILWFTSSSDDEESQMQAKAKTLIDIESPVKNLASKIPVSEPVNPLEEINQTASDETPPSYANLNKQNELKFSQLEEKLQQLVSDNNSRQHGQDPLHKDLQAQLTAQSIKIQQLQDNLKARQLAAAASTKKKPVKRYRKIIPPFTLVSIDQWGNDLYAMVRSQGQLHELTHGQTVNGWYVDSFDRPRNAVSFKNKSGTRRELFIKS